MQSGQNISLFIIFCITNKRNIWIWWVSHWPARKKRRFKVSWDSPFYDSLNGFSRIDTLSSSDIIQYFFFAKQVLMWTIIAENTGIFSSHNYETSDIPELGACDNCCDYLTPFCIFFWPQVEVPPSTLKFLQYYTMIL